MAACDFLEISNSVCLSQTNSVSAALVTGLISLIVTGSKFFYDYKAQSKLDEFKRKEQEARTNFEINERELRHKFEAQQAASQQDFQTKQAEEADQRQSKIRQELEDYISKRHWKDERRQERLNWIKQSTEYLGITYTGITSLINGGPSYDKLKMISETADVIDSFALFKKEVNHFSLYEPFKNRGHALAEHITEILLTLSLTKEVRESTERINRLNYLVEKLDEIKADYEIICHHFEEYPERFEELSRDRFEELSRVGATNNG